MIWISIFTLLLLAILGPIIFYSKRKWFDNNQGLVAYEGIILSLIVALFTINQTQLSIESSTNDFDSLLTRLDNIITKVDDATKSVIQVENSLSKLPSQIDNFSNSISSLNNVIESQKEQLNSTLIGFNSSIQNFRSSVDSMVKRFSRKPDLDISIGKIDFDSIITVNKIIITNYGDLMADIYAIRIECEPKLNSKVEWDNSIITSDYQNIINYQKNCELLVTPNAKRPGYDLCNITFNKYPYFILTIRVYYKAEFGNSNSIVKVFGFEGNEMKELPKNIRK